MNEGGPVHGVEPGGEADLAQGGVGGKDEGVEHGVVRRVEQDNRGAVIAAGS